MQAGRGAGLFFADKNGCAGAGQLAGAAELRIELILPMKQSDRESNLSSAIHRAKLTLLALFFGGVIAFMSLAVFFSGTKTNFEDATVLGAETTSIFGKLDGYPIHCRDDRDLDACLVGANERNIERSVLWLGNSQVHAVNQWREGEVNAPPILFEALKKQGLDLLTFSQPNANLQEHYVLFEYLRRKIPLHVLVLPVVFDDMREDGLREEVAVLAHDETTAAALNGTEIGQRLLAKAQSVQQDTETAGIAQTAQERVERSLNTWLEEHSRLWQARPEIRGQLFLGLYQTRNALFGIKPTTKRKVIPSRYRHNLGALRAILSVAERNNIGVVLYVAPLRGGVEMPYVEEQYSRFKSDVEALTKDFSAVYTNLETLVPDDLWGTKGATAIGGDEELDFMHFQAAGHKILANELEVLVAHAVARRVSKQ